MILKVASVPRVNDQPPHPPPAYQPGPGFDPAQYAPYQGYPEQPPGPPAATGTNGFAIASLVFGLLGGILFALVFGIVALVQLRKRRQNGRGLAIAGIVLASVWVLVIAAGVTAAIIADQNDTTAASPATADGSMSVLKLKPGNCLNDLKESGSIDNLPVVPCTTAHEGEVYAVFDLADGPWPGDAKVQAKAEERCNTEFDEYAKAPDDKLELFYLHPLQSTWWRDRAVTCIATDPAGTMTGSLRD
jgi:hypothetical protein